MFEPVYVPRPQYVMPGLPGRRSFTYFFADSNAAFVTTLA
jgi:hypothetical protein